MTQQSQIMPSPTTAFAILPRLGRKLCGALFVLALPLLPLSAQANGFMLQGTVNVCASYQKADKSWSPRYRAMVAYMDGAHLNKLMYGRIHAADDDLFAIIVWRRGEPTVIDLQQRQGLSTAATVLKDMKGKTWQISRTWRRCSDHF